MKPEPDPREAGQRRMPPSRRPKSHPERSAAGARSADSGKPKTPPLPRPGPGDHWVYILTNERRTVLYIGLTTGLLHRASQDNLGIRSRLASRYHAHTLVYFENYSEPKAAIAREKQLKKWTLARKEALIARFNPAWRDLAPEMTAPPSERTRAQRHEPERRGASAPRSRPKGPGASSSNRSARKTDAPPKPDPEGTRPHDSAGMRCAGSDK